VLERVREVYLIFGCLAHSERLVLARVRVRAMLVAFQMMVREMEVEKALSLVHQFSILWLGPARSLTQ
jgi:hypothetical protein